MLFGPLPPSPAAACLQCLFGQRAPRALAALPAASATLCAYLVPGAWLLGGKPEPGGQLRGRLDLVALCPQSYSCHHFLSLPPPQGRLDLFFLCLAALMLLNLLLFLWVAARYEYKVSPPPRPLPRPLLTSPHGNPCCVCICPHPTPPHPTTSAHPGGFTAPALEWLAGCGAGGCVLHTWHGPWLGRAGSAVTRGAIWQTRDWPAAPALGPGPGSAVPPGCVLLCHRAPGLPCVPCPAPLTTMPAPLPHAASPAGCGAQAGGPAAQPAGAMGRLACAVTCVHSLPGRLPA